MISLPVWNVSTQAICHVRASRWKPINAVPVCSLASMRVE
jgi:hypothetical protein